MQQKEKKYQLLSTSFEDPLYVKQWYIVSYNIFFLLTVKSIAES